MNSLALMLLLQQVFSNPVQVKLLASSMNMLPLARDLLSNLQDKWSGSRLMLMISPLKLETSKGLKLWKDIPSCFLPSKDWLVSTTLDAHLTLTLSTIPMSSSPHKWDPSVLDHDFPPYQAPCWSTPEVDLLHFDSMHDASGDFSQ